MKIAKLTCLIVLSLSALSATAAESDKENNPQCIYQGNPYSIGSPINIDGQKYVCVIKNGKPTWLPAEISHNYL
ncbi:hypothetical protein [Providencia rettgeri]|uniref:hypothetical protein n=1 Tax=Providencia rettgeri TaxID=587 RepID=UPI001419D894|nr:hypothetical protein [Providencia rettgeri]NIH07067.1 hypothetical protein [Providencia rettgeri]